VGFLLRRAPSGTFHYAPLHSRAAHRLLEGVGAGEAASIDSVLVIEGDAVFSQSEALIAIARRLPRPWRWLTLLRILPRRLRDGAYDALARRRTGWFGRSQQCLIPPGYFDLLTEHPPPARPSMTREKAPDPPKTASPN
jgi:predicted DCC family thiol-disulfide oxidoreductase YuxK